MAAATAAAGLSAKILVTVSSVAAFEAMTLAEIPNSGSRTCICIGQGRVHGLLSAQVAGPGRVRVVEALCIHN